MDTTKRMGTSSINIMKYFTQEWCWGDLNDTQIKQIEKKYDDYINCVYSRLTFPLKLLANRINLHDGIVKKLKFFFSKKKLILFGIFGDLEVGYFYLTIEYIGIKNVDPDVVFRVFAKKKIEVIRDEMEILKNSNDECFVHRFIFSNKSEFQVEFIGCNLKIESASEKDYRNKFCTVSLMK